MGIISWIIIGILAGWIAEEVMKRNHGLLTNLIVGVVGALLGGLIAGLLGIGARGLIMSLVIATAGAILLLLLLGLVRRRTYQLPIRVGIEVIEWDLARHSVSEGCEA